MEASTKSGGILSDGAREERDKVVEMLKKAYWMEIETVMSYIANSINPDGIRAREIAESLAGAPYARPSLLYSRRKPSKRRRWPSSSWRMVVTMSCVTGSLPSQNSMIWL